MHSTFQALYWELKMQKEKLAILFCMIIFLRKKRILKFCKKIHFCTFKSYFGVVYRYSKYKIKILLN